MQSADSGPMGTPPASQRRVNLSPIVNRERPLWPHTAHAPVVVVRSTSNNDGKHGAAAAKASCRR
jgi:hypothetical protein